MRWKSLLAHTERKVGSERVLTPDAAVEELLQLEGNVRARMRSNGISIEDQDDIFQELALNVMTKPPRDVRAIWKRLDQRIVDFYRKENKHQANREVLSLDILL